MPTLSLTVTASNAAGAATSTVSVTRPDAPLFSITPGVEFATTAWCHQRLAANAPLDATSAQVVSFLINEMRTSAGGIGGAVYCINEQPVYVVDAATPTVRMVVVPFDGTPAAAQAAAELQTHFNAVPMPFPATFVAEPPAGGDMEWTIYRPSTHELWEAFSSAKTGHQTTNSAGQLVDEWYVVWGGYIPDMRVNLGWFPTTPLGFKPGATATGIPIMSYLITANDIKRQAINHAVGLGIPASASRVVWWNSPPAQRTDGFFDGPQYTAEGAIFRLPANIDLNAYPASAWDGVSVKPFWRLVAEAMRDYGVVIFDKSALGVMQMELTQTPQYASDPMTTDATITASLNDTDIYSHGGSFCVLDQGNFPWDRLQLLQMNLVSF